MARYSPSTPMARVLRPCIFFAGPPSEGWNPLGGLILSGTNLYGTTEYGGSLGKGTVFVLTTNGAGFTTLHHFAGAPGDGGNPYAGLILSSNILYGATWAGGSSNKGAVFAGNTDGTGFTNLYGFTATGWSSCYQQRRRCSIWRTGIIGKHRLWGGIARRQFGQWHGVQPCAAAAATDHHWFRSQCYFDVADQWRRDSITPGSYCSPPRTWFQRRSGAPFLPVPVVVNGQNAVTNPIAGTRNFYRLSQ